MSGGQGSYYASLAREDYYLNGGEPPGEWLGSGAEKLGLKGKVTREEFLEIFDGFRNGEALVQNAGKVNHRPGWDLTFSAPKSVSVAWSQADQATGQEIRAAHLSAVEKALDYIEKNGLWTRRGKAGSRVERCAAIFAAFEHGTSRAGDPNLHSHALLLNLGVRADGSIGSLETRTVYQLKMAAGAIYRAELARQLERRLGFGIVKDRFSFALKGVSKELVDEFSKRAKEIKAALEKMGLKGSKAAEFAALDTRGKKMHLSREELFQNWRAVGKEFSWGEEELKECMHGMRHDREAFVKPDAVRQVLGKMMEKNSYFTERELVRFLAEEAQITGVGADAVLRGVGEFLKTGVLGKSPEVVPLGIRIQEPVYTTAEMLELEKKFISDVDTAAKTRWLSAAENPRLASAVDGVIDRFRRMDKKGNGLNEEQIDAIKTITQGSAIACVSGMAGTGKTTMLKAAREVWEEMGYNVIGAALAGKAARGLEEGSGIKSDTIAMTLKQLGKSPLHVAHTTVAPNAPKWSPVHGVKIPHLKFSGDFLRFNEKTVLVIDEAGMVGTRQMDALLSAVTKAGGKLVAVGDAKQLQPIDAGGPFLAMTERVTTSNLTSIVRQSDRWRRDAVKEFAEGNATQALEEHAKRGFVHVEKDRDAARNALFKEWKGAGVPLPKDNLILAAMNEDVTVLNRMAQEARRNESYVTGPAHSVKSNLDIFQGDRVVFTKKSRSLGVENGDFGTVKEINERRGKVTVELDGGRELTFSTKNHDHLKLGYAVTTHKAQGVTAKNAFLLTSEEMQDKHITYVQASRASQVTRFFTTEAECGEGLAELARRMERENQKKLAVELMKARQDEEKKRSQSASPSSSTPGQGSSSGQSASHGIGSSSGQGSGQSQSR
jgi:conjugative relaxase-like TrwC/TraI family protein